MNMKFHGLCGLLVLCAGMLSLVPAAADVYRSVDENGHVVFSDKPSPGAEKVDIPPPQTMPAEQVKNPDIKPSVHKQTSPGYKNLAIVSPKNQQAIRANDGNVTVSVAVNPPLRPEDGLVLYLDGDKQSRTKSKTFNLANLDRGQHEAHVEITDTDGNVIKTSPSITFYVLRHSILHPHRTAPP